MVGETVLDGGGSEDMRETVFRHELGHALGLSPGAWNVDLNQDGELDRELLPGHEGTCPIDSELTFAGSQAAAAWQADAEKRRAEEARLKQRALRRDAEELELELERRREGEERRIGEAGGFWTLVSNATTTYTTTYTTTRIY